jgi:TRAP-type C4-dicarboxylate transport system permease large subunit
MRAEKEEVVDLGVDPIHFGIVMILNLCIGLCTLPVGTLPFVGCGVTRTQITQVIQPLLPMPLAMIAVLTLVTALPWLRLGFPGAFGLLG